MIYIPYIYFDTRYIPMCCNDDIIEYCYRCIDKRKEAESKSARLVSTSLYFITYRGIRTKIEMRHKSIEEINRIILYKSKLGAIL